VERPSETFRKRLLLGQGLPHAGPESLGPAALKPVPHWPEEGYPYASLPPEETDAPWEGAEPYRMSLADALEIGARNSREYQAQKESVFLAALDLDVERNRFRNLFFATLSGGARSDRTEPEAPDGVDASAEATGTRLLKTGALLAGTIAVDLAKLLSGDKDSSLGVFADASITIPLLRGAGRHVVTEPLTLAERETVYAIRAFERFRQVYAVRVASEYYEVLRLQDQVENAAENYRNLVVLGRRTRALAGAGRLALVQVDQARQDELRARDRWIAAQQAVEARLDAFKELLGLPPDARIELDRGELRSAGSRVAALFPGDRGEGGEEIEELPEADAPVELVPPSREGGPLEVDEPRALATALGRRQDLVVARARVEDAQRAVAVAADALRAGLALTGSATAGERRDVSTATAPNGKLRPERGVYAANLLLDLPLERTAERDAYRESFLLLEEAVRGAQQLEDRVKIEVRERLRTLLEAREAVRIQEQAVRLAEARVESTGVMLQAARAQVRDVLEAQEALVSARNALTAALLRYRVAELELLRDMGVLAVKPDGIWAEEEIDA
jgi:outer membrane protein TolC